MNPENIHTGQVASPPKRELSPGSKLRFWKQAFLASVQSGESARAAASRADAAVERYNAKFQELFQS